MKMSHELFDGALTKRPGYGIMAMPRMDRLPERGSL